MIDYGGNNPFVLKTPERQRYEAARRTFVKRRREYEEAADVYRDKKEALRAATAELESASTALKESL